MWWMSQRNEFRIKSFCISWICLINIVIDISADDFRVEVDWRAYARVDEVEPELEWLYKLVANFNCYQELDSLTSEDFNIAWNEWKISSFSIENCLCWCVFMIAQIHVGRSIDHLARVSKVFCAVLRLNFERCRTKLCFTCEVVFGWVCWWCLTWVLDNWRFADWVNFYSTTASNYNAGNDYQYD